MEKGKLLFELKNGEKKWMTKSEYNHYINRLSSLKSLYEDYVENEFIDSKLPINEQIHQIVDLGIELMGIICSTADKITIVGYNSIKSQVNKNITKEDFVEIIKFVSHHMDNNSTDDTKLTQKMLKEIDKSVFKINFKRVFYNQFIEFNDFAVTETPENIVFPKIKYSTNNKKFKEIVNSCAKARQYLDQKLWPQYKEYAALAEYVSHGDLNYERYKKLVDYKYYTGNDDKRFQTQDKRWEKLVKNFLDAYRLCKKYDYNYFEDVENEIYNNLLVHV